MSQEAEDLFNEVLNEPRRRKQHIRHVWDNFTYIGEVQKSPKQKVVVSAATRDGIRYVQLTEYYLTKENEWHPRKGGIVVPLCVSIHKDGVLCEPATDVLNMMSAAIDHVKTMALYDEEHKLDIPYKPRKKAGANVGNYTPRQLKGFIEKYKVEYEFLDELRESGETNIWGATPYIIRKFAVTESEATHILFTWMATFEMRHTNED